MHFDRFDTCEALYCLAHDWGLYGLADRLESMKFKPSPMLTTDNLEENGREIYDHYDAIFVKHPSFAHPYDPFVLRGSEIWGKLDKLEIG